VPTVDMSGEIDPAEWSRLQELFPWLQGIPGYPPDQLKKLMEATYSENATKRREARDDIRRLARQYSPDEGNSPLFEWEWMRSVAANPSLTEAERETLWTAYYAPSDDVDPDERSAAREDWNQLVGPQGRSSDYYGDT
jgi:hypothetical protein